MQVLFAPFLWLKITYPGKWVYDWLLPLLVGVLASYARYSFGSSMILVGDRGLVEHVLDLLLILTGFFIAALGVVSTIRGHEIDRIMIGEHRAELHGVPVTRRRYLSLLFGYLALSSLLLYLLGSLAEMICVPMKAAMPLWSWGPLGITFSGLFVGAFSNIILATMIGLYYLSDRLFREQEKQNPPPPSAGPPPRDR